MSGNTDARPRSGGRHHNTTGGAEYSGGLPAACDAGYLLGIATTPAACCLHPCLLAPAACILACLLRRLLARGSAASSFAFVLAAFIVVSRVVRVNPNPTRNVGYPKCRVFLILNKFLVEDFKTRNFKNPKNPIRNFRVARTPSL